MCQVSRRTSVLVLERACHPSNLRRDGNFGTCVTSSFRRLMAAGIDVKLQGYEADPCNPPETSAVFA